MEKRMKQKKLVVYVSAWQMEEKTKVLEEVVLKCTESLSVVESLSPRWNSEV